MVTQVLFSIRSQSVSLTLASISIAAEALHRRRTQIGAVADCLAAHHLCRGLPAARGLVSGLGPVVFRSVGFLGQVGFLG